MLLKRYRLPSLPVFRIRFRSCSHFHRQPLFRIRDRWQPTAYRSKKEKKRQIHCRRNRLGNATARPKLFTQNVFPISEIGYYSRLLKIFKWNINNAFIVRHSKLCANIITYEKGSVGVAELSIIRRLYHRLSFGKFGRGEDSNPSCLNLNRITDAVAMSFGNILPLIAMIRSVISSEGGSKKQRRGRGQTCMLL